MASRLIDWQALKKELYKYPNVVGMSQQIQRKISFGHVTDQPCIRVYVSQKLPEDQIQRRMGVLSGVIPKTMAIVGRMPYATDVVELGVIKALHLYPTVGPMDAARCIRYRPLFAAISTGDPLVSAGTMGQPCKESDQWRGYLSNWHIFKGEYGSPHDDELQPGHYDNGQVPQDVFGTLWYYKDVQMEPGPTNLIDAAYARVTNLTDYSNQIARQTVVDKFVCKGEAVLTLQDRCFFTGRTTPYGEGIVIDDAGAVRVQYERGVGDFVDQYIIQFSPDIQGGNSGSPVYTMDDKFVGLAFAGGGGNSIVCKWPNIKTAFPDLTLDTDQGPVGDHLAVYVDDNLFKNIPFTGPGEYVDNLGVLAAGNHLLHVEKWIGGQNVDQIDVPFTVKKGSSGMQVLRPEPNEIFEPGAAVPLRIVQS